MIPLNETIYHCELCGRTLVMAHSRDTPKCCGRAMNPAGQRTAQPASGEAALDARPAEPVHAATGTAP